MESKKLKDQIVKLIKEKKGTDIVVLDLRKVSTVADYFIICTGSVEQHVKAICDNILDNLNDKGIKSWHREGLQALSWILIDYVDVVVHIFKPDSREFYNLEKFWADAKKTKVKNDADGEGN